MASAGTSTDVIIVGSGHNGLVAAVTLAAAGKRVLVLEGQPYPGGATVSARIFPEYDAQISRYSYLISLFSEQLADDLGLQLKCQRRKVASFTPWQNQRGEQRGLLISNDDEARTRKSLRTLCGTDDAWQSLQRFEELRQEFSRLVWPTMLRPLQSRSTFEKQLVTAPQRAAWEAFVERPLGEYLEQNFANDLVRGLLMTDGRIGLSVDAHDPTLLQNRCFIYHVIGNLTGEWRVPTGGMQALTSALLQRCAELGVQIKCGCPVMHLETGLNYHSVTWEESGRQRSCSAEYVLVNAGRRTEAAILNREWNPEPGDEGSVIKINMLLKRLPEMLTTDAVAAEAFAGTLHLNEGYEQMRSAWRTAQGGVLPAPPPGELYCHTLTDPSILSPELQQAGFHTVTLFGLDMPWRVFETRHDERREQVLRHYLDSISAICQESIEDCLAVNADGSHCVEVMTPQDLQRAVGLDYGNIFHNQLSWFFTEREAEAGSWGVETEIPRVLRAGSSAMRGGAVSGIPGWSAAQSVLGKS